MGRGPCRPQARLQRTARRRCRGFCRGFAAAFDPGDLPLQAHLCCLQRLRVRRLSGRAFGEVLVALAPAQLCLRLPLRLQRSSVVVLLIACAPAPSSAPVPGVLLLWAGVVELCVSGSGAEAGMQGRRCWHALLLPLRASCRSGRPISRAGRESSRPLRRWKQACSACSSLDRHAACVCCWPGAARAVGKQGRAAAAAVLAVSAMALRAGALTRGRCSSRRSSAGRRAVLPQGLHFGLQRFDGFGGGGPAAPRPS